MSVKNPIEVSGTANIDFSVAIRMFDETAIEAPAPIAIPLINDILVTDRLFR